MIGKIHESVSVEKTQEMCSHPAKSCLNTSHGIICGLCGKGLGR